MTRRPPGPPLDPIEDLLVALEALLARPATPADERLFRRYLDLFLRWNRVHRMTALDSPSAIVRDLFIDSLLFLKVLPPRRPLAVVDIGAGGGIPGLPMRMADPAIRLTLVEAKRKRISFLRTACRELDLGESVAIVEGRAENVVKKEDTNLEGAFDVAVSRAVSRMERLLPTALPYLKAGGSVIVSAGPGSRPAAGVEAVDVRVPGSAAIRRFFRSRRQ